MGIESLSFFCENLGVNTRRNTMKRNFITFLLIVTIVVLNIKATYGCEREFINNNGIEINQEEYNRLIDLGFTSYEIINLSHEEYEQNNNLTGEIVVKYTNNYNIDSCGLNVSDTETEYKLMTITIVKLSNGNYRYKVNLKWKKMPSTRSYDVIGIGINSNAVNIVTGITSKQSYSNSSGTYSVSPSYTNKTTNGGLAVFKLPTEKLTELESYLYFDVSLKNLLLRELVASGDYSHAQKNVSLAESMKANVNEFGLVMSSSVVGSYDEIKAAKAIYSW